MVDIKDFHTLLCVYSCTYPLLTDSQPFGVEILTYMHKLINDGQFVPALHLHTD